MEEPQRVFKGIWIPREIWEHPDLSMTDRCLLAEIDSLTGDEGCFASREWMAERIGCSIGHLKDMLTKLRDLGLIVDISFNGRRQIIATSWSKIASENKQSEKSDPSQRKFPTSTTLYIEKSIDSMENPIVRTPEDLQNMGLPPEEQNRLKEKKARKALRQSKSYLYRGIVPQKQSYPMYQKKERTFADGRGIR